ncbi:hypothetical protein F4677DRAFT_446859 [Hypoxylon crocopeplum]|nr:hypothetical protein F4677DRAFT_446859 [Hypoxylon crocopeplum]
MGTTPDEESARHLLEHQERSSNSMSDENDSRPVHSYWSSWEKRSSAFTALNRRLTRKHYFIGLALLLVITVFLANPYYSFLNTHRPESPSESSESQQHVVSVTLLPVSSTEIAIETAKPAKPVETAKPEKPTTPADSKSEEKPKDKPEQKKPADEPKEKAEKKPPENPPPPAEKAGGEAAAPSPKKQQHGMEPANPDYCTTWPIDAEGKYAPKPKPAQPLQLDSVAPEGGWKKPAGVKVIAMVFYGRRRNVDILDCYLRQNLAAYGGYLDEVWFMVHTPKKDDVDWLRGFVEGEPGYRFMDLGRCTTEGYGCIWEYAVEDDTIYIKIDDDILYIHHDTIPQLIHTRLAQPHPYAISAQLVNSPVTGWQQFHYGAIHPFLPDPKARPYRAAAETWRPSEMGLYPAATRPLEGNPLDVKPPYRGHPWLLLSESARDTVALTRTPMGAWNHDPGSAAIGFGPGWTSWAAAAQQLYSLLYNLEQNKMDRYHFGRALNYENDNDNETTTEGYSGPGGEQLYDMQYERYNLNFVAVWGRDVAVALPIKDDELEMTSEIPRRLGRPFVIDTRAVVAHYAFFTQREGISKTDLLDRWRAFANENVCSAANQKRPWDTRCEGF